MTAQEYQQWLMSLKDQKITPLYETVDAGQAESATPEGRQQAYILDPEGNKFLLQQRMEQQAEAATSTATGDWQGSGLIGGYYGSEADGNAGAKGGTYMNFSSNDDGTLSATTDPRQVLGNDESWWTMWRPIMKIAATAALGGYGAGGGSTGWVSAEGGAGYAGGLAADSSALADAATVGSDWSAGAATTNGASGVYNTDPGMTALSEVGLGTEVPAAVDSFGAGSSNTAVAPVTSPVSSTNTSATSPVSNTATRTVPSWLNEAAQALGISSADLLKVISSGAASAMNNNTADRLMDMYKPYAEASQYYGNKLKASYDDPGSYLKGPDAQAALNTTGDYLQRKDAAGGGLSNNFGRQVKLNDYLLGNLSQYRNDLGTNYRGLASIGTGQGAYNATEASGNAANPLLYTLSGLGQPTTTQTNTIRTTGS